MCYKSESLLSDVDMLLSQVNVLMSEINVKMSSCRVQSKLLLPRVSTILSEMEFLVKISQNEGDDDDDDDNEESYGDGSLGWDHKYDYDNNYYDLNNNLSFSSISFLEDDDHDNVEGDGVQADGRSVENEESHDGRSVENEESHDGQSVENEESHDGQSVENEESHDGRSVENEEFHDGRRVENNESHDGGCLGDDDGGDLDEADLNIAHRVLLRRRAVPCNPSTADEDHNSSTNTTTATKSKQAITLIDKVITFLPKIAPNLIFSKKKSGRRRKKMISKKVHPELRVLWQSFGKILPSEEDGKGVSIYPRVDWNKVNQRMIKNIPEPGSFPVHGVSEDPDFYKMIREHNLEGWPPASQFHNTPYPFGHKQGYYTSAGVIPPVFDDVIHGYIWSEEDKRFVIHAEYDKDSINYNPRSVKEGGRYSKKPKKRKVESR